MRARAHGSPGPSLSRTFLWSATYHTFTTSSLVVPASRSDRAPFNIGNPSYIGEPTLGLASGMTLRASQRLLRPGASIYHIQYHIQPVRHT